MKVTKQRARHEGTLAISWGPYGGFYWIRGYCTRLCLGWIAITYVPVELEDLMHAYVGDTITYVLPRGDLPEERT